MILTTECSECGREIELTRDALLSGSPWSICAASLPAIAPAPTPDPPPPADQTEEPSA